MNKKYDEEFHFPDDAQVTTEAWASPDKATDMEKEFPETVIWNASRDEYADAGTQTKERKSDQHRLLKQMMLAPVISAAAVISLVCSSFGYDPLGEDLLIVNNDSSVSDEERSQADLPEESPSSEEPSRENLPEESESHEELAQDESSDEFTAADSTQSEEPSDAEEVNSITTVMVHVTYVPTGETFMPDSTGEQALADAEEWVVRVGGDVNTMQFIRSETTYMGVEYSDDFILVGDPDNLASGYIAQGTATYIYQQVDYYEAYAPE